MAFYQFEFPSKALGFPADTIIYVPEGLSNVPVLWLLHGANNDAHEWFDQTSVLRYASIRGLAIVTTSIYNGFYVNMHYGAPYADFLENEWIPSVRNLFPCLSDRREKNFIAGASMGGFGALRLAVNCPRWFSKVGAFAGSIEMPTIIERNARGIQPGGDDFRWAFGGYENMVQNKNDVIYMAGQCVEANQMPEVYLVCGTEDFGYALNLIARDDLRKMGAKVTWREALGIHSYNCWDPELPAFLDWLEGKGDATC